MGPPLGLRHLTRATVEELLAAAPVNPTRDTLIAIIKHKPQRKQVWSDGSLHRLFAHHFVVCWRSANFLNRGFGMEVLFVKLLNLGAVTIEGWDAGGWEHVDSVLDARGTRSGQEAWMEVKCGAYNKTSSRYFATEIHFNSPAQNLELLALDPSLRTLNAHLLAARYCNDDANIWSTSQVEIGFFTMSAPQFAARTLVDQDNISRTSWKPASFGNPDERDAILSQTASSSVALRKGGKAVTSCEDLMFAFGFAAATEVVLVLPALAHAPLPLQSLPPLPAGAGAAPAGAAPPQAAAAPSAPPPSAAAASAAAGAAPADAAPPQAAAEPSAPPPSAPLLPAAAVGAACFLRDIFNRPELNGEIVVPLSFDEERGRFEVAFVSETVATAGARLMSVLPAKLLPVPPPLALTGPADGGEPGDGAVGADAERREDTDGRLYTFAEFIEFYGEGEQSEKAWAKAKQQ